MSNRFCETILLNNSWNGNIWHWAKEFIEKWRVVAVLESIQSRFEFSIHLPVGFPVNQPRNTENVWKVQNDTGRSLAQLHPSNVVRKILCLVAKFSNWWIVQKRCFMKTIWHRISIQTLLYQDTFATRQNGVGNRDKVYSWFCYTLLVW